MFAKLRTARHLKVRSNGNEVLVGFNGSSAAIAAVHQYGLSASPSKNKDFKVQYAQRELLGFTEEDIEMIERFVLKAIADGAL